MRHECWTSQGSLHAVHESLFAMTEQPQMPHTTVCQAVKVSYQLQQAGWSVCGFCWCGIKRWKPHVWWFSEMKKLLNLQQRCSVERPGSIAWCGMSCDFTPVDIFWSTRAVQKVSDLNFFRLNKSSPGSVLHCSCGGDIYAHAWISSCLQTASVAGSRSMIVYVLWALGRLSVIAKWRNELSSVIALNFAKGLAILKLKLFERFNRLSGTMSWVSHE